MNKKFEKYIQTSKQIAASNHIDWSTPTDASGRIDKSHIWDLSKISGAPGTPRVLLNTMRADRNTVRLKLSEANAQYHDMVLSENWQDFIKAVAIQKLLVHRNKASPVKYAVLRPLAALAAFAGDDDPWKISRREVNLTHEYVKRLQPSEKLACDLLSTTRVIIDQAQLSDFCPISPPRNKKSHIYSKKTTVDIRTHLNERKFKSKLPTEDAFWEITRIVWEETPRSSLDIARFAVIKVMIMCGLRVSEVVTIPENSLYWVDSFPNTKKSISPKQAVLRTLRIRYFASKKRSQRNDSITLFSTSQHIPDIFHDVLSETIKSFHSYSTPLRTRLKAQCKTGRIFPDLKPNAILSILEFYTRLTGEPFLYEDPKEKQLIQKWKDTYDLTVLDHIEKRQKKFKNSWPLKDKVKQYFKTRLTLKLTDGTTVRPPFTYKCGVPYSEERFKYNEMYFRVSELEAFLKKCVPTKLSDCQPHILKSGKSMHPHEFLFLAPKRALAEERNGMICDIRKYAFIGVVSASDVIAALSTNSATAQSLFKKYSQSSAKKQLQLTSHEFRHLQNTELFRLGVSDTIITKRFNRNSIQQSYVYDHRSLSEDLKSISIPKEAREHLFGNAGATYRMIAAGLTSGPIVDEFKAIQKSRGDIEAFKFLSVEADGLHTTPYGHCVNSFTVDPCPKHLECFSGCSHLMRSPIASHTENLKAVKVRMEKLLLSLESHPAPEGAKKKMRDHAVLRKNGIEKMLLTPAGEKVFPNGVDLGRPIKKHSEGPFRE